MGAHQEIQSFPQQPTNNLMFYYVHSLMSVTRVLLALTEKEKDPEAFNSKPHIFQNIAVDNLIFLCQGIFRMREIGLWNNDQGQNLLDGGAPFYSIYKAKNNVYFTVACIESKFYKIFLSVLRDNKMLEKDYQYLLQNQLNQDEWPDMKVVIQNFFKKYKSKQLNEMFAGKDCCVHAVLTEKQAIESDLVKDIVFVVTGRQAKDLIKTSAVWQELQKEVEMKRNIVLTPPAKL